MRNKILIVDDHTDFRTIIRRYLEINKVAADIFEASTAEMAIAKAACIHPDIVLMVISLQQAIGLYAIKEIKVDTSGCDVIVRTMFEVDMFKKEVLRLGAIDFIGKSELYDRLMPAVNKCLDAKKSYAKKGK